MTREFDRVNRKLKDAYRDQDRLGGKLRDAEREADRGARATRRVSRLEDTIAKLEADINRLRSERNAAEDKVQRLEQDAGPQTASELLVQMNGMQSEIKMLQDAVKSHRKMAERTPTPSPDEADHAARITHMQKLVDSAASKLNHWIDRYVDQNKKNEELRWMLEFAATQGYSEVPKKDIRQFLLKELPTLEKRLEEASMSKVSESEKISSDKLIKVEEELQASRERLVATEAELQRARSEGDALREEMDIFWKEMDSVSEAYDASREQNTRLLDAMTKRDEDNARLLSEAAAATRDKALAEEDKGLVDDKLSDAKKEMTEWKKRAEEVERTHAEALRDRDAAQLELTETKDKVESLNATIKTLGIGMDSLRSELSKVRKEVELVEAAKASHLTELKLEKTRADRAHAMLSGSKEDAEFAALRKMVNCSVCSTRLKDRMITRCNHLFCSECILENLASRHRKCPGCGGKFGEADVQPFFFT
jgi:E3 ubiquitin-protein ligase BRE1